VATTAGGVFAGAKKPFQPNSSMLGRPCSRTVGRSGSASVRFGESVASARSAPPRTWASDVEIWSPAELDAAREQLLHQRSGAAERHVIHLDAGVALQAFRRRDASRCPARSSRRTRPCRSPCEGDNSFRSFAGTDGWHITISGTLAASDTGVKSSKRVPRAASVLQRGGGGRERDVVEQQRVAVGRRLGDLVRADRAAASADVLHHDRLPERSR
jgi:hypothetical protein